MLESSMSRQSRGIEREEVDTEIWLCKKCNQVGCLVNGIMIGLGPELDRYRIKSNQFSLSQLRVLSAAEFMVRLCGSLIALKFGTHLLEATTCLNDPIDNTSFRQDSRLQRSQPKIFNVSA